MKSRERSCDIWTKRLNRPFPIEKEKWWKDYMKMLQEIQGYFKERPQDLLTLDICAGEGWKKLCPFLGVPIPKEDFPHKNKGSGSGYSFLG